MLKTVNISSHKRKIKGKVYIVKKYNRVQRKLGKKVKYDRVGTFYVAHDELGNFKGSKVVKDKKSKDHKLLSLP